MKRKDLIYLSIAVGILLVSVFLIMNVGSGGKKKSTQLKIEVVDPIKSDYNPTLLAEIGDKNLHRNFAVRVDLKTELGNKNPFGN